MFTICSLRVVFPWEFMYSFEREWSFLIFVRTKKTDTGMMRSSKPRKGRDPLIHSRRYAAAKKTVPMPMSTMLATHAFTNPRCTVMVSICMVLSPK